MKKKLFSYILLVAFLLIANVAHLQYTHINQIYMRVFNSKNGLPNNDAATVYEAKNGYVWISGYGLHRFDGYNFKTYELSNVYAVHKIFEDEDGEMYVSTLSKSQILKLNKHTQKFELLLDSIVINGNKQKLNIARIGNDENNKIWMVVNDRIGTINKKNKQIEIKTDEINYSLGLAYYKDMQIDKNGLIWFIDKKKGICSYNTKTNELIIPKSKKATSPIYNYKITLENQICFDNNFSFWLIIGDRDGREIVRVNATTLKTEKYQIPYKENIKFDYDKAWIEQILIDRLGTIWVVCGEYVAIAKFNTLTNKFEVLYSDENSKNGYLAKVRPGEGNMQLFEGRNGNFWIGSNMGLHLFNPQKQAVNLHLQSNFKKKAFGNYSPQNQIASNPQSLLKSKAGNYYLSYFGLGVLQLDSNFNNAKPFINNNKIKNVNKIWSFDDDTLYLNDNEGNIALISIKKQMLIKYLTPKYLKNCFIVESIKLNDSIAWLVTKNTGLIRFNYKKLTKTVMQKIWTENETNYEVSTACNAGNKKLWLGTISNGVILYNTETSLIEKHFLVNPNTEYTNDNNVQKVYMLNNDTLVYSTTKGLCIRNIITNKFEYYGVQHPNGYYYLGGFIPSTNKKSIWINSLLYGLYNLNIKTGKIEYIPETEGNIAKEGYGNISFSLNDKIFMGNTLGITEVDESKVNASDTVYDIKISEILINGNALNIDSVLANSNTLNLKHNETEIEIFFSTRNIWRANSINYFMQLETKDTNWVALNEPGRIYFNALAQGNYTLKIKAQLGSNENLYKMFTLKININRPFQRSIVFFVICIALGSVTIYKFLQWRNSKNKLVENLKIEQLSQTLEIEQINNFIKTDLDKTNTIDKALWTVASNLVGKLGFEDCIIYLWNEEKTKLIKKAGYGPKGSLEQLKKEDFTVIFGQGIVGTVAETKMPILISDTRNDARCRSDDEVRLSELCVPILSNNELIGIIDSENSKLNYYTQHHLNLLQTIATLIANKITEIKALQQVELHQKEVQLVNDKLAELQLSALRSQMNPHFIFNSLNSINSFIIDNNVQQASEYLTKFSRLIRMILENSKSQSIELIKEIEALKLYILMESLRFNNKFEYQINIDEDVDTEFIKIPPTTIQPYVENAIWHGLLHLSHAGFIHINISMHTSQILKIVIDDNGIGRKKSLELKSKISANKSYGIYITQQRILQLNEQNSVHIIDKIDNTGAATGTQVIIKYNI